MSTTTLVVNGFALACLLFSLAKDRPKTLSALRVSAMSLLKLGPAVGVVILLIGLLLGLVPRDAIGSVLGAGSGLGGTLLVAVFGAVLYMPALVAFPLAGSLLESGASVASVGAFITTLTMVGTVTLPLEIKTLGAKLTLLRNGLSFVIALIIALLMGAILS
ncbi:MAG: permease [Candidatus Bipolaricaulota bacterium]